MTDDVKAAVMAERAACLACVEAEPEFPGLPWRVVGWRKWLWMLGFMGVHPVQAMRCPVIATKRGIAKRIRARGEP